MVYIYNDTPLISYVYASFMRVYKDIAILGPTAHSFAGLSGPFSENGNYIFRETQSKFFSETILNCS